MCVRSATGFLADCPRSPHGKEGDGWRAVGGAGYSWCGFRPPDSGEASTARAPARHWETANTATRVDCKGSLTLIPSGRLSEAGQGNVRPPGRIGPRHQYQITPCLNRSASPKRAG